MELTIATLNEILLPPFLFFVTFCFLCCQLSRLGATVTIQPETKPVAIPQPEAIEEIQVQTEQEPVPVTVPTVEELTCAIWAAPVVEPQTAQETDLKPEPGASQQSKLHAPVLAVIDNLGKREARKVMGGLKLQQKRNGVELSTELMVASIRREFKVDPERVIEVIRERLPELLPANSDPQQLAS